MTSVAFRGVTKHFDHSVALDDLSLDVDDGEFLVLLGPSGCGKTTALRIVAGLEEPDRGEVALGERVVNDVDPKSRDVAMVFQSYALYPHLTVRKNIEFPLRQRHTAGEERGRRVEEVARSLGLDTLLDRKPAQLSGGQRQRVALARAIVRRPQVFLMDEPLSNLDAALRVQTRADIVSLQQRLGVTTLYVTHDQVEAMTMGQRIAVLNEGRLQQVATPHELYAEPANAFVARFVGNPGMNIVDMRLDAGTPVAHVPGGTVPLDERTVTALRSRTGDLVVGFRPERLRIDSDGTIKATVAIVELLGAEVHVLCRLEDGTNLTVRQGTEPELPSAGDVVRVGVDPHDVYVFEAQTGLRVRPHS
jgi:multiple sugar transport system ATP-binding protein